MDELRKKKKEVMSLYHEAAQELEAKKAKPFDIEEAQSKMVCDLGHKLNLMKHS